MSFIDSWAISYALRSYISCLSHFYLRRLIYYSNFYVSLLIFSSYFLVMIYLQVLISFSFYFSLFILFYYIISYNDYKSLAIFLFLSNKSSIYSALLCNYLFLSFNYCISFNNGFDCSLNFAACSSLYICILIIHY